MLITAMPQPEKPLASIPEEFDPEQHCGAIVGDTVCMRPAGWGVAGLSASEKKGYRCTLHSGSPALVIGHSRGPALRKRISSLEERIEAIRKSAELLTLEDQIATLRALWEYELQAASIQSAVFEDYMQQVREALDAGLEPPPIPPDIIPRVDMKLVENISRLVRAEYEMRYTKRFSVPLDEVGAMLLKLVNVFNKIAEKYGIPREAREEYAKAVLALRTSPVPDPAMDRVLAGPQPEVIEGEVA